MPEQPTLEEIETLLRAYVAGLDAATMSGPAAARDMQRLARIRNLASAGDVLLAKRVEVTGAWRGDGHHSAADWIAAQAGTSVGAAARVLETSERIEHLPATAQAVRAGELSADQARIVADAASVDPAREGQLVDTAQRETFKNFKDESQRVKAAALDDAERQKRAFRGRSVRQWIDDEGADKTLISGPAGTNAKIMRLLKPHVEDVFRQGRKNGSRESHENRQYDGFMQLVDRLYAVGDPDPTAPPSGAEAAEAAEAESAGPSATGAKKRRKLPGGNNTKTIMIVDLDAWLRGYTIAGETSEVVGVGPVPVELVREMSKDAFIAVALKKGKQIVGVAHQGRGLNAAQRTALEATRVACSNIACNRTVAIQVDHRYPYVKDPVTEITNQDPVCETDHYLKTHHGWMFEPGTGRRRFLPPDHPDHPGPPTKRDQPATGPAANPARCGSTAEGTTPAGSQPTTEPAPAATPEPKTKPARSDLRAEPSTPRTSRRKTEPAVAATPEPEPELATPAESEPKTERARAERAPTGGGATEPARKRPAPPGSSPQGRQTKSSSGPPGPEPPEQPRSG